MLRTIGSAVAALILCSTTASAKTVVFQTSVAPQPDEDIVSDCHYELTIMDVSRPVRGVWVIFDRGRDMLRYYGDESVQSWALRRDVALLMPFMCPAKSYKDMNVDPARGLGRALLTALDQLADQSSHAELKTAKLVLLGFSGAGSFVARLADYAPRRAAAVIAADPGHFVPLGMDTVSHSAEAMAIPELVLAGGADEVCGTERPYEYFRRYFDQGAHWTFVLQNNTPHCCIMNAKRLVLDWLDAVLQTHRSAAGAWAGFVRLRQTDRKDSFGLKTSEVVAADIRPAGSQSSTTMAPSGWLPSRKFANEWRAFVLLPEHPVTSLP